MRSTSNRDQTPAGQFLPDGSFEVDSSCERLGGIAAQLRQTGMNSQVIKLMLNSRMDESPDSLTQ